MGHGKNLNYLIQFYVQDLRELRFTYSISVGKFQK